VVILQNLLYKAEVGKAINTTTDKADKSDK
jgi:hypothetical protein